MTSFMESRTQSPVPSRGPGCRALYWQAAAFSPGGDDGRRPPGIRRNAHKFAAARDCRTIAIYEYTPSLRCLPAHPSDHHLTIVCTENLRSEERRVGKEGRSRWW